MQRAKQLTFHKQRADVVPISMKTGKIMPNDIKLDSYWWMPDPGSAPVFILVSVKEVDSQSRSVVVQSDDAGDRWTVPAEEVLCWDKVSSASMSLVDDLARAPDGASQRSILSQLRRRFHRGFPYVRVGDAMVFLQPKNAEVQSYIPASALHYRHFKRKDSEKGQLPVHIYEVFKSAHEDATQSRGEQSVLILGRNGSGQSDMLKLALGFLEQAEPSGSAAARLVRAVEVLETFGGARTGQSNLSSCFSQRWILEFRKDGYIVNAKVQCCLLEKSRVTFRLPGESNFKIFHCLTAGSDNPMHQSLQLPSRPKLLAGSKAVVDQGGPGEPAHDFYCLCASLRALGFTEDEIGALLRSVGAVLALGELEFDMVASTSNEPKGSRSPPRTPVLHSGKTSVLTLKATPALQTFATLAGCDASAAKRALTVCDVAGVHGQSGNTEQNAGSSEKQRWSPVRGQVQAGRSSRDARTGRLGKASVEMPLTCMQASQSRDKLCRALYMQIFEYLVNSISEKLSALPGSAWEGNADGPACATDRLDLDPANDSRIDNSNESPRINLIDFAGFACSQANSLELFCTNYINEWLQTFFQLQLWTEAEIHSLKGIKLEGVDLEDNSECVKALSHDGGVLGLLEEATLAQSGSDTSFLDALQCHVRPASCHSSVRGGQSNRGSEPTFRVLPQSRTFQVRHYAANVSYNVTGWVAMNRDRLTPSLHQLVQGLGNPIFARSAAVSCSGSTQVTSLRSQLSDAISTLESSHRRYVWCIRPNRGTNQNDCTLGEFEDAAVWDQLQKSGLLHAIALNRVGYPHKISVCDFIARYGALIPDAHSSTEEVVDAVRRVGGFAPDAITVREGQIFFRDSVLEELENMSQNIHSAAATHIQAAWRRHQVCAERRAYVGSFMVPAAKDPDPGQALQEVEDLLLQLRVCPPPRFFDMRLLERRFLSAAELRRKLLQRAIEAVATEAASASRGAESPGDGMSRQLHETLRQHLMVAHRFRLHVEPEAEACLQQYKEWEQTQQLDTSLATMLPLLQGGASLQEVQEAVSEMAQSPLWQSYGQESAEEAILEPCLSELAAWADSRVSCLIDEAERVASPRVTDENYMQVLSKRLQELQGLEHLLSTLRGLPPLKRSAAAEMHRLHAARIRAAFRGLDKALENGGPAELEKQLKHTCTVLSEANVEKGGTGDSFGIDTAANGAIDKRAMQLVPLETRQRVADGIQSRLHYHCEEVKTMTADSKENLGDFDYSMVPEGWTDELKQWIKLTDSLMTHWDLTHSALSQEIQGAKDLLAKYSIWQCQSVEQDCITALGVEIALRSGPEGIEVVEKQCLDFVKQRLGSQIDGLEQIMSRALKCAVVKQMLLVVEKAPIPNSFDAEVTSEEVAAFEELLPWWRYTLDQEFTWSPESSSAMVRVSDFTRRCMERLEQIEVEAAISDFSSEVARADAGASVESMLSSRSSALSSKLRETLASCLTPEDCAEKLRPAAAHVLTTRVQQAINCVVGHARANEPATADDAWLNYLGLEVGSGKFTNVSFQAVHELKTWLKQWVSWGGIDHDLAERAEEALETCREWAIVERWMVARESVRPLVEIALEKGLDKMNTDVDRLVAGLSVDLSINKSEASGKVKILVLLEAAVRTQRLLSEINFQIGAATNSDGLALPPGIRHFGRVPRPRIAQLRRAVELLSIHPMEVAETINPCLAESQELLADFIRWQPYAQWVEALARLACIAAGPGAITDLARDGKCALQCRPAALPEKEACERLHDVLQDALAQRWATISKSIANVLPSALGAFPHGHELIELAPPWYQEIEELRALHNFFEHDAPKLELDRPEWFKEASARLESAAAWEKQLVAEKTLAELVSVILDKGSAQVLLKVRHSHAHLTALGWAKEEVRSFISAHSEVTSALTQRIGRAYEESCKWTRPRSARRTPRTPRTPPTSVSPRRSSSLATTPRHVFSSQSRQGLLQSTVQGHCFV